MGCFSQAASYSPIESTPRAKPLNGQVIQMRFHDCEGARVDIQQALAGSMTVGRIASTGHDLSFQVEDQVTVLLPLTGVVSGVVMGKPFKASANEILILPRGKRETSSQPSENCGFSAISLLFPMSEIRETIDQLGGSSLSQKTPATSA